MLVSSSLIVVWLRGSISSPDLIDVRLNGPQFREPAFDLLLQLLRIFCKLVKESWKFLALVPITVCLSTVNWQGNNIFMCL